MNESVKRSFWFNLLKVLAIALILYIIFFASLSWFTRHGEQVKIPNVTGQDLKTAMSKLEGMKFEIYVDSTYEPKIKPFTVLKQVPDTGSIVKTGRTIFLTVNKAIPPQTPMPNLVGLSYRSAEMILKNNKLFVGDTTFRPDIAAGAILQVLYKHLDVKAGQMIPQGSKIDLVVGDGLGITDFSVPDVTGSTFDEARGMLSGSGLQFIVIAEGDITGDSTSATVIDQTPRAYNETGAPNKIKAGDIVDLRIKQNPTPEEIHNNNVPGSVNKDKTP